VFEHQPTRPGSADSSRGLRGQEEIADADADPLGAAWVSERNEMFVADTLRSTVEGLLAEFNTTVRWPRQRDALSRTLREASGLTYTKCLSLSHTHVHWPRS
jgi:hypothetical protein